VPSSQALPGFLITAPPSVCVSAVLVSLAVWIQEKKSRQNHCHISRIWSCSLVLLNWTIWRAQLFVTERTGGYNILMSGWVAPYFSPSSARVVFILGICSPFLGSCPSCFESTCASERGLGDFAHARDDKKNGLCLCQCVTTPRGFTSLPTGGGENFLVFIKIKKKTVEIRALEEGLPKIGSKIAKVFSRKGRYDG